MNKIFTIFQPCRETGDEAGSILPVHMHQAGSILPVHMHQACRYQYSLSNSDVRPGVARAINNQKSTHLSSHYEYCKPMVPTCSSEQASTSLYKEQVLCTCYQSDNESDHQKHQLPLSISNLQVHDLQHNKYKCDCPLIWQII